MPCCPPNGGHRDIQKNSFESVHCTLIREIVKLEVSYSNLIFIHGVGLVLITRWF